MEKIKQILTYCNARVDKVHLKRDCTLLQLIPIYFLLLGIFNSLNQFFYAELACLGILFAHYGVSYVADFIYCLMVDNYQNQKSVLFKKLTQRLIEEQGWFKAYEPMTYQHTNFGKLCLYPFNNLIEYWDSPIKIKTYPFPKNDREIDDFLEELNSNSKLLFSKF